MSPKRNPQVAQMADESMVRTLRYQTLAIWPQELPLFTRYGVPPRAQILDVGCGTGEATSRLAVQFPEATLIGVDVGPEVLAVAQRTHTALAPQLSFETGDGFHLRFADNSFDLVLCRHVTQLLPEPEKLLAELVRVLRPGGTLHVLSEDYGMIHFADRDGNVIDDLWHRGAIAFAASTHTDARIGRRTLPIFRALGLTHLHIDYLTVDTERVPREWLAGIFTAWRDGYSEALASAGKLTLAQVHALFAALLASIDDPECYGVWHVPVISGRKAIR